MEFMMRTAKRYGFSKSLESFKSSHIKVSKPQMSKLATDSL